MKNKLRRLFVKTKLVGVSESDKYLQRLREHSETRDYLQVRNCISNIRNVIDVAVQNKKIDPEVYYKLRKLKSKAIRYFDACYDKWGIRERFGFRYRYDE